MMVPSPWDSTARSASSAQPRSTRAYHSASISLPKSTLSRTDIFCTHAPCAQYATRRRAQAASTRPPSRTASPSTPARRDDLPEPTAPTTRSSCPGSSERLTRLTESAVSPLEARASRLPASASTASFRRHEKEASSTSSKGWPLAGSSGSAGRAAAWRACPPSPSTWSRTPAVPTARTANCGVGASSPAPAVAAALSRKRVRRRRATEAWASWPESSPKNMMGKRVTEKSESAGNARSAVSGRSGRASTAAARASAVASCGSATVIVMRYEKSRSSVRTYGSSRSRSSMIPRSNSASHPLNLSARTARTSSTQRLTRVSASGRCAARAALSWRTR
mmetsp:Transcript_14769/g.41305  ORF Transcript_14769/g.41305 Transcript_14769/m.41305 type:complete len:336 (+) Transcript_14769:2981-3988(+)|eukprot:scaffold230729_cov26-Tisochrysis_lutea.AAC.6